MPDRHVVQWGRLPPPLGGVTRSVELTRRSLHAHGVRCDVIDPGHPERAPVRYLRGLASARALGLVHCSRLASVGRASWVARLSLHPTVCYLHASGPGERLGPAGANALRSFSEVWAANANLAEQVASYGMAARLVSPYPRSGSDPVTPRRTPEESRRLLAFCYRGEPLYRLELARDATEELRRRGVDADLTIVLYGGDTERSAGYAAWGSGWLTGLADLDEEEANAVIGSADVLLRPTLVDGDSLTVRQALSAGTRVVASDLVPRPAGVELVGSDDPAAWADAVQHGAPLSTGTGVGEPVDDVLLELLGRDGR